MRFGRQDYGRNVGNCSKTAIKHDSAQATKVKSSLALTTDFNIEFMNALTLDRASNKPATFRPPFKPQVFQQPNKTTPEFGQRSPIFGAGPSLGRHGPPQHATPVNASKYGGGYFEERRKADDCHQRPAFLGPNSNAQHRQGFSQVTGNNRSAQVLDGQRREAGTSTTGHFFLDKDSSLGNSTLALQTSSAWTSFRPPSNPDNRSNGNVHPTKPHPNSQTVQAANAPACHQLKPVIPSDLQSCQGLFEAFADIEQIERQYLKTCFTFADVHHLADCLSRDATVAALMEAFSAELQKTFENRLPSDVWQQVCSLTAQGEHRKSLELYVKYAGYRVASLLQVVAEAARRPAD